MGSEDFLKKKYDLQEETQGTESNSSDAKGPNAADKSLAELADEAEARVRQRLTQNFRDRIVNPDEVGALSEEFLSSPENARRREDLRGLLERSDKLGDEMDELLKNDDDETMRAARDMFRARNRVTRRRWRLEDENGPAKG